MQPCITSHLATKVVIKNLSVFRDFWILDLWIHDCGLGPGARWCSQGPRGLQTRGLREPGGSYWGTGTLWVTPDTGISSMGKKAGFEREENKAKQLKLCA